MKVSGVAHTSYSVSDIERSKKFYCDLLGCQIIWEREIVEEYFREIVCVPDCVVKAVQLRIPGSDHVLELFEYAHPRGERVVSPVNCPGSSHMAFTVDDINSKSMFYTHLEDKNLFYNNCTRAGTSPG